jgi:hypothetical protein
MSVSSCVCLRHVCTELCLFATCLYRVVSVCDMSVPICVCLRHVCIDLCLFATCLYRFMSVCDMSLPICVCLRHVCIELCLFATCLYRVVSVFFKWFRAFQKLNQSVFKRCFYRLLTRIYFCVCSDAYKKSHLARARVALTHPLTPSLVWMIFNCIIL